MRPNKWLIASVATGAVVLAGAAVAGVAAADSAGSTSGAGPGAAVTAFINDVAQHLGVQPSALQSAIQQADIDRVNQLQAAGKITAAQAQNMISRIQSGQAPLLPGFAFDGPRDRGGFGSRGEPVGLRGILSGAAQYLGITPQQLVSDLRSGKTLAQVADSTSGKSAQGLASALTADMKGRLDQAVQAGKITAAQEQTILSNFQANLQKLLAQTFPSAAPQGGTNGAPLARSGHGYGHRWWGGASDGSGGGSGGAQGSGSGSGGTVGSGSSTAISTTAQA